MPGPCLGGGSNIELGLMRIFLILLNLQQLADVFDGPFALFYKLLLALQKLVKAVLSCGSLVGNKCQLLRWQLFG